MPYPRCGKTEMYAAPHGQMHRRHCQATGQPIQTKAAAGPWNETTARPRRHGAPTPRCSPTASPPPDERSVSRRYTPVASMPSCGAFCRASASWKHCATKNLLRTAPMSCTVTFLMPTSEQSSDTRLLARTPQPSWRGMTRIFMRWKLWSTRWKTVWPRYSGTYVRLEYESMCALATASCAVAASASPRPRSPCVVGRMCAAVCELAKGAKAAECRVQQ
eukprot:351135-Chlamydomonas_euryale.AAC.3